VNSNAIILFAFLNVHRKVYQELMIRLQSTTTSVSSSDIQIPN